MDKRIVLYSHNGFGLGHVRRNFLLARAVRAASPTTDILLITGSPFPQDPALSEGIDYVRLPSFLRVGHNRWVPKQLPGVSVNDLAHIRSDIITSVVKRFDPDVLVADHLPQGIAGELLPALEWMKDHGGRTVAGFRDILDAPDRVKRAWGQDDTVRVLDELYTKALIYGSRKVFDFRNYGLPDRIDKKTTYCGYLGRPPVSALAVQTARAEIKDGYDGVVLACAGGGADGLEVLRSALDVGPDLREQGIRLVAVTGPLMSSSDEYELLSAGEKLGVEVRRRIEAFPAFVAASDALIGMCGYNTVCETVSYRTPLVAVPRQHPSVEQLIRARAFSRLGLLKHLEQDRLTPSRLLSAVTASLREDRPTETRVPMDGTDRARDALLDLL